jgi:transcriptional regulator with PAS, ATPase and Fis domain
MPLSTQAKLLRALQNHEIQRVGSHALRKVEVRIIAATNRDLRALAASGQFRQDLYYRIAMVEVLLPTLRERLEDLPVLVEYLVQRLAAQYEKEVSTVHPDVLAALQNYSWPGNVRELENVVGTAILQAQGSMILPEDLPALKMQMAVAAAVPAGTVIYKLNDIIEQHVLKALEISMGNKLRAAEMLGISRSTLYRMLETYISKAK